MNTKNDSSNVMKVEQKINALAQMNLLKLKPEIVEQFVTHGTLFKSVNGKLVSLTPKESSIVADWEKQTGCLAYHVIYKEMFSCILYNILYASPSKRDREADLELIGGCKDGLLTIFTYCINQTIPAYSEFGLIQVLISNGALQRID